MMGDISFPLKITHYPIVMTKCAWEKNHPDVSTGVHVLLAATTMLFCVALPTLPSSSMMNP